MEHKKIFAVLYVKNVFSKYHILKWLVDIGKRFVHRNETSTALSYFVVLFSITCSQFITITYTVDYGFKTMSLLITTATINSLIKAQSCKL